MIWKIHGLNLKQYQQFSIIMGKVKYGFYPLQRKITQRKAASENIFGRFLPPFGKNDDFPGIFNDFE